MLNRLWDFRDPGQVLNKQRGNTQQFILSRVYDTIQTILQPSAPDYLYLLHLTCLI